MNLYKLTIIWLLLAVAVLTASEKKQVQETFEVEPGQLVDIRTVSGLDVKVESWDKNEVYFDLIVKVDCSDADFEKEYIEKFYLDSRRVSSGIIIDFEEEDDDNGWNFWDIFKGKFYYSFSKEITGTIYVPKDNSLKADFRYSDIELDDITGEITLHGRSNDLYLKNCPAVNVIENDYGKNIISNCGGKLILDSRSSEIDINGFSGPVRVIADYADIDLKSVSGMLDVTTRSATVKIDDIGGDLELNGDYSNIKINKVNGFASISSRSGTIDVSYTQGLHVESPYTDVYGYEINDKSGKDVKIYNQSGKIRLEGIKGRVIVDDKYSNINLKNIEGHVIIESQSSSVSADKVTGNWKSDTRYSSVKVHDLSADEIKIDNRSESVDIRMTKIPKLVEIKNEYGSVDFSMPRGFKGGLDLFALYGDIVCDLPVRIKSEGSTTRAVANLGSNDATISIETRSGDIELIEIPR